MKFRAKCTGAMFRNACLKCLQNSDSSSATSKILSYYGKKVFHGQSELMNPDFWRQIGDTLETWDRIGTGLGLAFFSRAEH